MDATNKLLNKTWDYLGWAIFDDAWGDQLKWNQSLLSRINESGADILKQSVIPIENVLLEHKKINFNSNLLPLFNTITSFDESNSNLADRFTVVIDETIPDNIIHIEIGDDYIEMEVVNI